MSPKTKESISDRVYEHLLSLVLQKKLMPGERISEAKIAKQFETSRSPVKMAFQRLDNEGLLKIYPNRFVEVANYTAADIIEIGTMRLSLDTLSVKLAGLNGSRLEFENLRRIADECYNAAMNDDEEKRKKYDVDFHMYLSEISRNSVLIKAQRELYLKVQFLLTCRYDVLHKNVKNVEHHIIVADALMQGDLRKAVMTSFEHIADFYSLQESYPASFYEEILKMN